MTGPQKILLGVASVVPALYLIALFTTPLKDTFTVGITSPEAPDWMLIFVAFHFLMYLYIGLLIAFFMIHLFGNPNISKESKAMWAFSFVLLFPVSMPAYWYLYIYRDKIKD